MQEKENIITEQDYKIINLEYENNSLKEKIKKYQEIIKSYNENFDFSRLSNINKESEINNNLINTEIQTGIYNINNHNHNLNHILNHNLIRNEENSIDIINNEDDNDNENMNDSHILTEHEQTLIELNNDFTSSYSYSYEDNDRTETIKSFNRIPNCRYLSDRSDDNDTENLNEINICENYFVDLPLINIENEINADGDYIDNDNDNDEEINLSENGNNLINLELDNSFNFNNTNQISLSPTTTFTNFHFHNFNEAQDNMNIEEMTYEELIDLQDRIGIVSKGMSEEDKKVN